MVGALLATALAATFAAAQDQPPSTATAPTEDAAHQMPAGPGTDMAQFCSRLREPVHYYPGHARDLHIEGSASLECALNADNRIQTCWVLSETPAHEEFGLAGLKVMCRALNAPPTVWARFHVDGDARPHIRAPANFRLNEQH